jgi:hypothetical protein
MPAPRAAVVAVLLTVVGLTVTGCGDDVRPGDSRGGTPSTSTSSSGTTSPPPQDAQMKIRITIDMTDHGSVEKTGPLPAPLSRDGQPDGADPDVGDVGYYAPGNDLVFYYGDRSYHPGIVILDRLDGDAASRIADMDGAITATVEAG